MRKGLGGSHTFLFPVDANELLGDAFEIVDANELLGDAFDANELLGDTFEIVDLELSLLICCDKTPSAAAVALAALL